MKIIFKRLIAYIIDIIIVSLVATLLTSNNYINKDYNKYQETYKEYEKYATNYKDFISDLEELKISELKDEYKNYNKYLENIDSEELSEKDIKKIKTESKKEYKEKLKNYSYKLSKLSIIQKVISILCILLYFVVFQYYFNGQTLGKKLMKLHVVSNNGNTLTIENYFIRSLILNELIINIISIICILTLNKSSYIMYNEIIYYVTYVLEMTIIFMIMFDKNNRGLHDYASNTIVIGGIVK